MRAEIWDRFFLRLRELEAMTPEEFAAVRRPSKKAPLARDAASEPDFLWYSETLWRPVLGDIDADFCHGSPSLSPTRKIGLARIQSSE